MDRSSFHDRLARLEKLDKNPKTRRVHPRNQEYQAKLETKPKRRFPRSVLTMMLLLALGYGVIRVNDYQLSMPDMFTDLQIKASQDDQTVGGLIRSSGLPETEKAAAYAALGLNYGVNETPIDDRIPKTIGFIDLIKAKLFLPPQSQRPLAFLPEPLQGWKRLTQADVDQVAPVQQIKADWDQQVAGAAQTDGDTATSPVAWDAIVGLSEFVSIKPFPLDRGTQDRAIYFNDQGHAIMVEITFNQIKTAQIVGNKKINTKVGVNQVINERLAKDVLRNTVTLGGMKFVQTRRVAQKQALLRVKSEQPQRFDLHTNLSQSVRVRLRGYALPSQIVTLAKRVVTPELRNFVPENS